MSSFVNQYPSRSCNISDSFVDPKIKLKPKVKGKKGDGEAKLYLGNIKNSLNEGVVGSYDDFFFFYWKNNRYYFDKKSLIFYIKNAEYEYKNQLQKYRKDIYKNYKDLRKQILSDKKDLYFTNLKGREYSGSRYYIRPEKLDKKHPWSFIRQIALPQISELKITKEPMAEYYAYKFELRFNTVDKSFFDHNSQLLIDANTNDLKKRHIEGTLEYERLISARRGQGYFREQVIKRMNYCIVTGSKEILEAAHIKPWAKANDEEKIDSFNGLLLTPNCHKLFDKGLMCFQDNGEITISNLIKLNEFNKLVNEDKKLNKKPVLNTNTQNYLRWHRNYFKKNFS